MRMFSWVFAALLAVASPATEPEAIAESPAQVMALPPALRSRLQEDVLAGAPSQRTRFNRLLHLLFDADGLGLAYQDDATASVARTYATRSANCLSFTMLFIALARESGLDAYPQEIPETLAWHQDSGILYRQDHINAVVRLASDGYLVDIARDSVIALRAPRRVSDQRLLAHYYNNLAMSDLEQDRIASALRNIAIALQLDPGYATNWSNAGVLYLRNGDEAAAERAYAKALALDPANTSALANMANLAQRQGDHTREAELRQRLERQQRTDPFQHFLQAADYESAGDYPHAIEHYQRAIRLHDGEPRFYAALAHAYALAGDTRQASKASAHAHWLSARAAQKLL
jgi:Flp pilus assembly protein TadD